MLNELVLKNVKAATVALGLVKKGSVEPFVICGSGFLVDTKGYVMTAGHVSGKIKELIGICKAKKVEVERAIFMVDPHERVDFVTAELDERVARYHHVQSLLDLLCLMM